MCVVVVFLCVCGFFFGGVSSYFLVCLLCVRVCSVLFCFFGFVFVSLLLFCCCNKKYIYIYIIRVIQGQVTYRMANGFATRGELILYIYIYI